MDLEQCFACVGPCATKTAWPEVLGMKGKDAKEHILKERPDLVVLYIECNGIRIQNCCCNRVFLDVETHGTDDFDDGTVCFIPKIG